MKRIAFVAPLVILSCAVVILSGEDELPPGKYRKPASQQRIDSWYGHYEAKKDILPDAPEPPRGARKAAVDFTGTYRFGKYDYIVVIKQKGDEVTFSSGGVDHQDIGGAFDTIGAGTVIDGKIHARWWCLDLSRNYANNGGCEMWFFKGDRNRLFARYYHDADERIEDGYGVRVGTHEGEQQHYRIRHKHPKKAYKDGLVLKGTVRGRDGAPVRDAVVMLRHVEKSAVRTDARGRWSIRVTELPTVQMVSAAAPGYRTRVEAIIQHKVRDLDFVLDASPYGDDARYRFIDPTRNRGHDVWNCGNCHRNSYEEWKLSRHAVSAKNVITRAVYEKDFLPALKRGEATGDEGLCAACHAPSAALDGKVARLGEIKGVHAFGNHCDFCHKIHHTENLDAPGVRGSLKLGRPSPDDHSVLGPIKRVYGALADSDYAFMGPVYNPYFATGALCAGCHQYTTANGLPALDTYNEWRSWAARQTVHKSCQGCHMPTGTSMEGKRLARRICVNGLRRPNEEQIHDHSFLGRELLTDALSLRVSAKSNAGILVVDTEVLAKNVGHRVPTGSADKHLLLVVLALDGNGKPYALSAGPRVPDHAGGFGDGDPLVLDAKELDARVERGDFARFPGREFAQVFADRKGRTHVPFWRAAKLVEDTRLQPDRPVRNRFAFLVPEQDKVTVRVELYHRLRFKRHDVAKDITKGAGYRPLDRLVLEKNVEVR